MKSHAFDPLSFIAGLAFAGIGIAAAAGGLDDLETLRVGWPLFLVGVGLLLVISTVRSGTRTRDEVAATDPAFADPAGPAPAASPDRDAVPVEDDEPPFDPVELDDPTPDA